MRNRLIYGKDCVFFIHGYSLEFLETLDQARVIQSSYDLEVVRFSWLADPGGVIGLDYLEAQALARNSVMALDSSNAIAVPCERPPVGTVRRNIASIKRSQFHGFGLGRSEVRADYLPAVTLIV